MPYCNRGVLPGFTLTAALNGVIYGYCLHNKRPKFHRVLLAALLANLLCSLCLDTLWLYMLTGKGLLVLLPVHLIKCAIMIPVQVLLIQVVSTQVGGRLLTRQHPQDTPRP